MRLFERKQKKNAPHNRLNSLLLAKWDENQQLHLNKTGASERTV